jgi:hydrogenase maturation protein HypF
VAAVRRFAEVSENEAHLLESRERPIVLLQRIDAALPESVAPGHSHLGFLLPYSPLHHLLAGEEPLVMTSGNRSDEPITRANSEAMEGLRDVADGFLLHDREIHVVCDDSVVRAFEGHEMPIRRSRGYAPMPLRLPNTGTSMLAVGGELKSTFCLRRGEYAYISQHLGDMENLETLGAFERALQQMCALFRVKPECVACDLHPGYLSTRWAREFAAANRLPVAGVQHHHAHVASLMAECGLDGREPIIGVAFDGTGYGPDGAIWGGELLLAHAHAFRRLAHLKYVPMPGGDAAVKRPCRMALAHLKAAGLAWDPDLPCVQAVSAAELAVLARDVNCVATSSVGRLFDAAASLAGLRHTVHYEAQGAMEFEAAADPECGEAYPLTIDDLSPLWRGIIVDLRRQEPLSRISARFHRGLANSVTDACHVARRETGVAIVGLTGGVFQNTLLTRLVRANLEQSGFTVLTHRLVPPNDGGLALGQALVAGSRWL